MVNLKRFAPTHIPFLDTEENKDIFYKDIPDGISSVTFGFIQPDIVNPLAIIGGSYSIQGFDYEGEE